MKFKGLKIGVLLLTIFVLTGCFAQTVGGDPQPAGFFTGIWHGWIAPIALIVSIFDSKVTIYDVNNIGFWYNFGYYMAIISGFGGLAFFRKKK